LEHAGIPGLNQAIQRDSSAIERDGQSVGEHRWLLSSSSYGETAPFIGTALRTLTRTFGHH
jgi:hypothetical protein